MRVALFTIALLGAVVANAAPPPGAQGWSGAYDERRGRLVVFGGYESNAYSDDTWEWNGSSWERSAATGPPGRAIAGMAYDEARRVTVLFGGARDLTVNGRLGDTWIYDGLTWSEVTSADGPPARDHHAMSYDPEQQRVILFGGGDDDELDPWQWNGTRWNRLTATGPSWRNIPVMVADRTGGRMLMFGGNWDPYPNDLWILSCDRWSLAPQ